jgi:hypothetical protein
MEEIIPKVVNDFKDNLRECSVIINNNFEILSQIQNPDERLNEIFRLMNEHIYSSQNTNTNTNKINNEKLGKEFEMAICYSLNIPYDGPYKYSMELVHNLQPRLVKLIEFFNYNLKHTASRGSRYDFTCEDDETIHLSAKTTKKDGKVCPQVVGQPSKIKFCHFFEIDNSGTEEIKRYIENNINQLLSVYSSYTFDCPIIYYNQHFDKLLFIKLKNNIDWKEYNVTFKHLIENKIWNESSVIKINNISIGEFQVHNHRDCIKFRWNFEKILNLFSDNFEIINL